MSKGHFIEGQWSRSGGPEFSSTDPFSGHEVWAGPSATARQVTRAVQAARSALEDWSSRSVEDRIGFLRSFAKSVEDGRDELAETISLETGKPLWESQSEVDAMASKIQLSIDAYRERRSPFRHALGGTMGVLRYRPIGVLGVLGPFNMPGHIPNGHIVPALLSGNTVVFKPSDYTPAVGEKTMALWEASGLPAGVINLVQGGRNTGAMLAENQEIDGLLFTGSYETGKVLHSVFAGHPEKMLALELGGNNPLVVFEVSNVDAAVVLSLLSAFLTAGQRCTCARRLIVERSSAGEHFLESLAEAIGRMRIGPYTDRPEPFCGPVITEVAAASLMSLQQRMKASGAKSIVEMRATGDSMTLLHPGLIDVTQMDDRADSEWFGPLLQVVRVSDFDAAIQEANRTVYGLAAGLLSDNEHLYNRFAKQVVAGHIVWNRQTTGASSRLPFGGLGLSGNHRPSGYFAVDYCSDPVVSLETEKLALPSKLPPGLEA